MRLILEGGDELAFGIAAIETLDFIVYKLKYCLFGIFPFLKGCGDVILIRLDLGVNIVTGHLDNIARLVMRDPNSVFFSICQSDRNICFLLFLG